MENNIEFSIKDNTSGHPSTNQANDTKHLDGKDKLEEKNEYEIMKPFITEVRIFLAILNNLDEWQAWLIVTLKTSVFIITVHLAA